MDRAPRSRSRGVGQGFWAVLAIPTMLGAIPTAAQTTIAPSQNPYHLQWATSVGDCDPATEICCLRQIGCALKIGSSFINTSEGTAFNRLRVFHAFIRSLKSSWKVETCPREVQLAYHFYLPASEEGPRAIGKLLSMPTDTLLELFESIELVAEGLGPDVWPAEELCPELPGSSEAEAPDPQLEEAVRLSQEAGLAHEQGEVARAERLFRESLAMHREANREPYVAAVLFALGIVVHGREAWAEAEALYREALAIERHLGQLGRTATLLTNLATVRHAQAEISEARELRLEAVSLYEETGNLVALAAELTQLVLLADAQRDHETASEFGLRAAGLYEKLEMPAELAMAHLMNGASFAERSLLREACGQLTRSRELYESLGSAEIEKVAQIEAFAGCGLSPEARAIGESVARAEAARAAGEHAKAAQIFGGAVKQAEEALGKFDEATIESLASLHGNHAYFLLFARQFQTAETAANQGLSLDSSQTWIYTNLAHALMLEGQVDEARTLYAKYVGTLLNDGRLWEDAVIEDFELLRKAGLSHDLMNEVLEYFGPDP